MRPRPRHTARVGYLLVVAIVAGIGLILWYSYYRKQQRREGLASFAAQYQMEYSRQDPFGLLDHDFRLLRMGDGRGCENVLSGSWQAMPVREADYWYYTESKDSNGRTSKSYKYFSVVIADLDGMLPYVSIQKESLFTKLADHLGFHDLDFESDDFNREFQVKAEDRQFAYKLIDARMIRWLLSTGGTFGFECRGENLLVYCHRLKPTALVPLFGTAKAFHDHVPSLVWHDYGTKPETIPVPPEPEGRSSS